MADRRRVNGPAGGTALPVSLISSVGSANPAAIRLRSPGELRKIFLKTGITPSASGSAYLEVESSLNDAADSGPSFKPSCLKLACTVHGPRPLPRSAPFTPQLLLSSRVKLTPFATGRRYGYIPEPNERDLAAHLETALRGSLIGERWPKSGLDIVVTVLEGDGGYQTSTTSRFASTCAMMSILSGCITVASAAIADANIDSVDMVTGGVAAVILQPDGSEQVVLDPGPADSQSVQSACVVGYLQSRDQITESWASGKLGGSSQEDAIQSIGFDSLVDMAVEAATANRLVLLEAVKESTERKILERKADYA